MVPHFSSFHHLGILNQDITRNNEIWYSYFNISLLELCEVKSERVGGGFLAKHIITL